MPVRFPPGRLRLSTKCDSIGSNPVTNTMGMAAATCLAARADDAPPPVANTEIRRRTRSSASAGRRSTWPSAQRKLDRYIASLDIAGLFESIVEGGDHRGICLGGGSVEV